MVSNSYLSLNRKFADIEAANHRLASALYLKDGERTTESLLLHSQETSEPAGTAPQRESLQDPDQCDAQTDAEGISKSRSASEVGEPKQLVDKHHQASACTAKRSSQSKIRLTKENRRNKVVEFSFLNDLNDKDVFKEAEILHSEYPNHQSQMNPTNNLSENSQSLPKHPDFIIFAQNEDESPPFTPELSPLSLDSCDFSAQMLADLPAQESSTDGLTDFTELFTVGNRDSVGHMDVESYFESICACQLDTGPNFGEQSESFTRLENRRPDEGENKRSYDYSCEEDRGRTADYFQSNPRSSHLLGQSEYLKEKQSGQSTDRTLISHDDSIPELQTHQGGSSCMLAHSLNFTPFEGVAQSFPVPPPLLEHRPVPTPPHEEDWLFAYIQKDRQFPYC